MKTIIDLDIKIAMLRAEADKLWTEYEAAGALKKNEWLKAQAELMNLLTLREQEIKKALELAQ